MTGKFSKLRLEVKSLLVWPLKIKYLNRSKSLEQKIKLLESKNTQQQKHVFPWPHTPEVAILDCANFKGQRDVTKAGSFTLSLRTSEPLKVINKDEYGVNLMPTSKSSYIVKIFF